MSLLFGIRWRKSWHCAFLFCSHWISSNAFLLALTSWWMMSTGAWIPRTKISSHRIWQCSDMNFASNRSNHRPMKLSSYTYIFFFRVWRCFSCMTYPRVLKGGQAIGVYVHLCTMSVMIMASARWWESQDWSFCGVHSWKLFCQKWNH